MSNKKQTTYGFDLNIIHDCFSNTERQGPGSPEITIKALSFIDNLTEKSNNTDNREINIFHLKLSRILL
jgi:hypothetical protein